MTHYQPYLACIALVAISVSYLLGFTPAVVGVVFVGMSLVAYYYYRRDKAAAVRGEWRVPESRLHFVSLCCGWPGALIAQYRFRHKTKKVSFRVLFWMTVVANVIGFSWLHLPKGNLMLKNGAFEIENFTLSHSKSEALTSAVFFLTHFRER